MKLHTNYIYQKGFQTYKVSKMFKQPEFYGSATVGERGQIVLPANLRKEFEIEPGDKLLVLGNQHLRGIMLVKAEVLGEMLENMGKHMAEMMKKAEESEEGE